MGATLDRNRRDPNNESAAALIWRHWQDGTVLTDLPAHLKPATRAIGYAIQAGLEQFSSQPRAGWKIAATSKAGQAHINVDGPLAGRLLAERLHRSGDRVSLKNNRMRVCEPEFSFRFAADLPPRATAYSVEEVMEQVSDLHLSLELPDSRYVDFTGVGAASLIADNACARDLVVGRAVSADWRDIDLSALVVRAKVVGRFEREGIGANVLGDPCEALTWLVNELSSLGLGARAGELVTTGTCVVPLELEPGDEVVADFGVLGTISVLVD